MLSQSKEVEDFPQRNLWSDCNHVPKLSFLNTKELLCVPFNADILKPSLVIWHRSNEETCTTGRSPRKTQGEGRAYRILPPKSGGSVLSLDVIRPTHAVNARHRAIPWFLQRREDVCKRERNLYWWKSAGSNLVTSWTFDMKLLRRRTASNGLHSWSRRPTKKPKINEKKALKRLGMGGKSHDRNFCSTVYTFPSQSFLMVG